MVVGESNINKENKMTPNINSMVEQKHELAQSVVSYGSGGGLIGFASLADVAQSAQAWAIILGCVVVAIRLVHDAIELYRYIRKKSK